MARSKNLQNVLENNTLQLVEAWLRADEERRFEPGEDRLRANAPNIRANILMTQLPRAWDDYRRLRNLRRSEMTEEGLISSGPDLLLQIGKKALESAALARASFVMQGLSANLGLETVQDIAWTELLAYRRTLSTGGLQLKSPLTLGMSINDAVGSFMEFRGSYGNTRSTFLGTVSLAASAIIEQTGDQIMHPLLPDPTINPSVRPIEWITKESPHLAVTERLDLVKR